jgi:hypothetical protein
MGLELPAQSLGYTHMALVVLLAVLALWRPPSWVRLILLGAAFLMTLALPVLWVGPVWTEPPEARRFAWDFLLAFASSLGIPFAFGAIAVTVLARRPVTPSLWARISWPLAAYVVGLAVSIPVSFNHALAYPLIR